MVFNRNKTDLRGESESSGQRRSRTAHDLTSSPPTDSFATCFTRNATEDFISPRQSRSYGTSVTDSPSRSSYASREEQLAARRKAIENARRRNDEMSRKIDLMMVGSETSYREDAIPHNSTADSTASNWSSGSPRESNNKNKKRRHRKTDRFVLPCTNRLSWLVSCILIVLIAGGIVAYFVATKSESTINPTLSAEDCDRARRGAPILGQELLSERNFDVIMDVLMDEVDVNLPEIMDLLAMKIQKHLIPKLVGCDEAQESRNNHINPNRFIIGNGKVQRLSSSVEENWECSFRLCLSATFNMDLFLKADVPADLKYFEIADLIADIVGDENLVDLLQLELPPFISVVVQSAINKNPTTTPSSTPTSIPSAAPSEKPTQSDAPSGMPTEFPTKMPSLAPTASRSPTMAPSELPSKIPTLAPTSSLSPSNRPSLAPSTVPSSSPTMPTTQGPTIYSTATPTRSPTMAPSESPSASSGPLQSPSVSPTREEDNGGYFHQLERPIRIACAGDSLTLGTFGGQAVDSPYPFQLQQMLGENFKVYNFGRNSVTALRGLSTSYVDTTQFRSSLDVEPDIYLLMLGHNDAKMWAEYGQQFRSDMEWIVNKVRSISVESPTRIMVAIPPWVKNDGAFGIRNDVLVNNLQPAIQTLATLKDLQLVNMYDVTFNQADSFIGDGLHLNKKGFTSLAEAWRVAVECNPNGICETGENCVTCPGDCYLNCS